MGTANALHTHGDGLDGGTDARTARLAQGGLLAAAGGAGELGVRTGVLFAPGSTALIVGTADTGPMRVQINPHVPVSSRGAANGAYLGPGATAAVKVPLAAAPASGSRIDVVYFKQQDRTPSVPTPDDVYDPLYGVVTGSVGQGKPSLAAIPGAIELGTVTVSAGATSTNGAGIVITNTAAQTVARGAPIPVRNATEQETLRQAGIAPGTSVQRLDLPGLPWQVYGGGTTWHTVGGDTGWVNTPGVGGEFSIGSGGSRYLVRNGFAVIREHIAFARTLAVGNGQLIHTLPTVVRPAIPIAGWLTGMYGGTGHGMTCETVLGTDGRLTVNGRGLTADGLQIFIPAYPVA